MLLFTEPFLQPCCIYSKPGVDRWEKKGRQRLSEDEREEVENTAQERVPSSKTLIDLTFDTKILSNHTTFVFTSIIALDFPVGISLVLWI